MRTIGRNVSWLTSDGYIDLAKVALDNTLARVVFGKNNEIHDSLRVLAAMQRAGRIEVGIFLIGFLINLPSDNMETRQVTVEALAGFYTPGCAVALFTELRRVKSSNASRRYIVTILNVLSSFPRHLVESEFLELAEDSRFSYKMRAKFRQALQNLETAEEKS